MNTTYWLCIYIPLLLMLYMVLRTKKFAGYHRAAQNRRKRGEIPVMEEIILKLMNKGVQISTINDTLTGKLTHYSEGWLTIADAKGREQCVNADYIVKIKEVSVKY